MSEFDGIQEREAGKHAMPVGMRVLFLGLIVFGIAYMYLYSPQTTGWNQATRYEEKVKEHADDAARYEREHEAVEAVEHEVAEAEFMGPSLYQENCAVCHGEKFEGGIGPALLGPTFIYGGSVEAFVKVIGKGTEKGMPAFGQQLGDEKVHTLAQYLRSKRN